MSAFNRPGGVRGPAGGTIDDVIARLEALTSVIGGQSGGMYDRAIFEELYALRAVFGSRSDCVTGDTLMASLCRLNNMLGVTKDPATITPPVHCIGFEAASWASGLSWTRVENSTYHSSIWTMQLPELPDAGNISTDEIVSFGSGDQLAWGAAFRLLAPVGTERRVCIVARHKRHEAAINVSSHLAGSYSIVANITDGTTGSGSCDDVLMMTGPAYCIQCIMPAEAGLGAPTAEVWVGWLDTGLGAAPQLGCCR